MINRALNPISMTSPRVDAEWLTATAEKVLEAVEAHRSTWQSWHVRAEAQRQVRAVQVPTDKVDQLVEVLVTEALHTQSISLTRRGDGISEPGVLCRSDGSSVYTVAGSELFTSARILAAEQRLVAAAGRTTAGSWTSERWSWRCWNRPRTGTLWMRDRLLWFVPCASPGRGCSWRLRRPVPGKPPPCAP